MEQADRQQCELIEELEELEGQNIGIVTLGGWVIGGQLGEVDDGVSVIGVGTTAFAPLIILGSVTILGPAFPGGILPLAGTYRVWSNLKTLTQVLRP